jgi:hypothetical protein
MFSEPHTKRRKEKMKLQRMNFFHLKSARTDISKDIYFRRSDSLRSAPSLEIILNMLNC